MLKEYFRDLERRWMKNAWEYATIGSLIIIIILWFINDRKGSYSSHFVCHSLANGRKKLPYHHKRKNESKGETITRNVLQRLFRRPFISIRPDFLLNEVTGQNLEIDCYNDELKLGVEYNGSQHEKYSKFFHKNYEHFRNQQYRDEIKKLKCKSHGITLVSIPSYIPHHKIENYLRNQLITHGYYV